ncbi:putative sialoadhesin-like isoform 2 [Scophthalmus maximus]|uniref:Putative sialoadhesin-like isoform 2 n=1 Tax=Scophthalmus maximus TaxID=52904 RepID=A0A2U9AYS2_SCOMX|nr:putative sialoadhesin-like isoform 2 [Scophthalmus maximus]
MDALNWPLFFVWLCFNAVQTEASSWTINVPSSVKGLPGSCVVIPCSFNYPDPGQTVTKFTGIWTEETSHIIYHPVQSKIVQQYRSRTELLGDITHKNCTLKIDPLQESDQGPFYFRVEIEDFNQFSYKEHSVSISMIGNPNMAVLVKEELVEGQTVLASCSVSPSCPTTLPVFVWSHAGEVHYHSQLDDGQWKATATLTFHPTKDDHNKPLLCTVRQNGGQQWEKSKLLKVKYAPVNVRVEYKAEVKEGEAVRLKCSSDAHPPASSNEWFNETGAQLHQGNLYMMPNVSRHTSALFCTATNTVGQGKSSPVWLSVLYAPEIKTASACSSEGDMVKCVCIVESKPPCMVHFVLSDRVLSGTKIERHGSVTIGTLQAEFGSSEFVHCLANNTEGEAKLTLSFTVNGKMQNLFIAITIGAGVALVILLIAVGFVKKCRGKSRDPPTPPMSAMTANKVEDPSKCATVQRQKMERDDVQYPGHHDNDPVYGNVEMDWGDAIYANM